VLIGDIGDKYNNNHAVSVINGENGRTSDTSTLNYINIHLNQLFIKNLWVDITEVRLKIKDVTASLIVDRSIFSIFYWSIDRSCFKTNIMSLCVYVCMCSHMLLKATNATQ
jgi:hypothetical protein